MLLKRVVRLLNKLILNYLEVKSELLINQTILINIVDDTYLAKNIKRNIQPSIQLLIIPKQVFPYQFDQSV